MNSPQADDYFGSHAQIEILKRARALFDILRGDGRFSCHGRTMGLVSPETGSVAMIARLAQLQGATHYAAVAPRDIDGVLHGAVDAGLQATHYTRWQIGGEVVKDAALVASEVALPEGLGVIRMTADTAPETVASFARTSLGCGVLPAWRSAHAGQSLRSCTLLAVTETGEVVSSAYAASYMTDNSKRARRECFWGMLATRPDWRGNRLSLMLGGRLLHLMQEDFGFTTFYTGVAPGNAPSEAVCHRLGLRRTDTSIVTLADPSLLPSGRMTK